jgi:hypothetical protein
MEDYLKETQDNIAVWSKLNEPDEQLELNQLA